MTAVRREERRYHPARAIVPARRREGAGGTGASSAATGHADAAIGVSAVSSTRFPNCSQNARSANQFVYS